LFDKRIIYPFTDEALSQVLNSLDWKWTDDKRFSQQVAVNLPVIVKAICETIKGFDLGDVHYFYNQWGELCRNSPKLQRPKEDPGEKIMYYLNGVPVTINQVKAKITGGKK